MCSILSLDRIDFSFNRLSGPLPPELGQMNQLSKFRCLSRAHEISYAFSHVFAIGTLELHHNKLSGEIPADFSELSRLSK